MSKGRYLPPKIPKSNRRLRLLLIPAGCILLGLLLILIPCCTGAQQDRLVAAGVDAFREQQKTPDSTKIPLERGPDDPEPTEDEQTFFLRDVYRRMYEHNRYIYETKQSDITSRDSFNTVLIDVTDYNIDEEAVGVVSIPAIEVEMPLYLSAGSKHLSRGFAQLSYTSMPIGGENTHCVIAGHRGWRGGIFLRNAHLLKKGDMVYLENYWGTLEYQIYKIEVIHPSQIDKILIQEGRDLLTIVTCTPYGVGSHRLMLYCERVNAQPGPYPEYP